MMKISFADAFGIRLMSRHEYNKTWSEQGNASKAMVSPGIYACRNKDNIILMGGSEPGDREILIPAGDGTNERFLKNFKEAVKNYIPGEHVPEGGVYAASALFKSNAQDLCRRYEECIEKIESLLNSYWRSTQGDFKRGYDKGDVTYVKVAYLLKDCRVVTERHHINTFADEEYDEIERYLRFICRNADIGMESILDIDLDYD